MQTFSAYVEMHLFFVISSSVRIGTGFEQCPATVVALTLQCDPKMPAPNFPFLFTPIATRLDFVIVFSLQVR